MPRSSAADHSGDATSPEDACVRWLTAEEREVWMSFAKLMTFLPVSLDAQLQREADLTQFEYYVLAHLSESPEQRARMSDLAMLANGSASRLSHVVARLERRGFVERRPRPDDRRVVDACLTPAGMDKIVASAPGHVRHVREVVFDALTPDQLDKLREISRAIVERVGLDPD